MIFFGIVIVRFPRHSARSGACVGALYFGCKQFSHRRWRTSRIRKLASVQRFQRTRLLRITTLVVWIAVATRDDSRKTAVGYIGQIYDIGGPYLGPSRAPMIEFEPITR